MEALNIRTIKTYLTEAQIIEAVNVVSKSLPTRVNEIVDFDEIMYNDSARICVNFDIDALGNLQILSADIFNNDWDVLDADSFAFAQYLEPVISDYNRENKELCKKAREIREDQKQYN